MDNSKIKKKKITVHKTSDFVWTTDFVVNEKGNKHSTFLLTRERLGHLYN